jgi:YcxB-like protein
MQISYALSRRDFFESMIAIRNRKNWAKWVFRLSIPVLGLSILFALFTSPRSQLVSNVAPLLFLVLAWTFLLWGSPWWSARTQFVKTPSAQGERTASFSSDGVNWKWNGGSSAVEWKSFTRWMETEKLFLLCLSPIQCGIVPKRALNAEQLSELRALLIEKIGVGQRV